MSYVVVIILTRAQFSPAANLVANTRIQRQLERVKLFGMRADEKLLDESPLPFEAAGTPLHSCRYITGVIWMGDSLSCK